MKCLLCYKIYTMTVYSLIRVNNIISLTRATIVVSTIIFVYKIIYFPYFLIYKTRTVVVVVALKNIQI